MMGTPRMLAAVAAVVLVGCDEVVLKPGEVEVVVAMDAPKTVMYAADEMTNFLAQALGREVPVSRGTRPRGCVAICLGDNEWSRAEGVDVGKLKRDAFTVRVTSDAVYIAGRDDARCDLRKTYNDQSEHATLFGVYEFLERAVGCRFYFPGELGTIVPRHETIAVPVGERTVSPDNRLRQYYFSWREARREGFWFDSDEQGLGKNWLRLRMQTESIPCCHGLSMRGYLKRFAKTHPEYFALLSSGTRSTDPNAPLTGQLCLTSGIWEEIYRDTASYLRGEPASVRGVYAYENEKKPGWGLGFRGRYVDLMCQDGMTMCHCPRCQAAYNLGPEYKGQWATDLVWSNTCAIARRLTAEGIDGHVTQMHYAPYAKVPDMEIPPNVDVMVAKRGPWNIIWPEKLAAEIADIRAWAEKLGHPVWIWTYPGKYNQQKFPDIPQMTPKAIGEYYKMVAPWIFGTFMEAETDRFIYNYLNYYMLSRVMWDVKTDVDAVLDEHYRLMFGAAADDMRGFYESLEHKWLHDVVGRCVETVMGPVVMYPNQTKLWAEAYGKDTIDAYTAIFDRAAGKVASGSLEARRIAFFRREFLAPLAAGAGKFAAHKKLVDALRWKLSDDPAKALRITHPFGSHVTDEQRTAPVETRVTCRLTGTELVFTVDCDEPRLADRVAADRKPDDGDIWRDDEVEVFLSPSGDGMTYYHFIVNSKGAMMDSRCVKAGAGFANGSIAWNSGAKATVEDRAGGWRMTLAIPRAALGTMQESFPAEFLRSRNVKGLSTQLYNWSPYSKGIDEIENLGMLVL